MTSSPPLPGHINTTKEAVHALLPGLDKKITAHIEQWRDSVPIGTTATVFQMLTYDVICVCPPGPWQHLKTCKGYAHGMPIEIVMDHLAPEGGPCLLDGITVDTSVMPWLITKTGD